MESAVTQTTQILRKNIRAVALLQTLAICPALCAQGRAGDARFGQFESNVKYTAANEIDALVITTLRKRGIEMANLCSDALFIRRLYLE